MLPLPLIPILPPPSTPAPPITTPPPPTNTPDRIRLRWIVGGGRQFVLLPRAAGELNPPRSAGKQYLLANFGKFLFKVRVLDSEYCLLGLITILMDVQLYTAIIS
jgi:hypothetical protein